MAASTESSSRLGFVAFDHLFDFRIKFYLQVFREVYLACFPPEERKAADAWDFDFDAMLYHESKKNHSFDVYWHSNKRSEAHIVSVALKLIPLFVVTLVALAFFSMVATLWGDSVSSKPCLGFIGIVITGGAIMASFGLMAWLNEPFVTICIATPFLALAIGLDDMHVLLAGWRLTDRRLSVSKRMEETLREAGTSIFITFLTNMIGFIIGSYMPYPAIQKLSRFTTAAMCLDFGAQVKLIAELPCCCIPSLKFEFQMTLFCASLVLFGRAEANSRHSLLPCVRVRRPMFSLRTTITQAILCASRHLSEDQAALWSDKKDQQQKKKEAAKAANVEAIEAPPTKPQTPLTALPTPSPSSGTLESCDAENPEADIDSSAIADFFKFIYAPALLSKIGKALVFLLYIGYLVRVTYGINQLSVGFRAENLFPKESTSYFW